MTKSVKSVWEDIEREGGKSGLPTERLYRALGASAVGIRAGYLPHQDMLELLIEVPGGWSGESFIPEWRGMGHDILALRLPPREEAQHLRLFLVSPEHREVFINVCEDLVAALEGITEATSRVREIEACLLRWRLFFERSGPEGLSVVMQQGLFAELNWLQILLEAGVNSAKAVMSWKGAERGYHDFDLGGHVVEVKSTRTKEPQSVIISNERQLDDRGLKSLHLYALILHEAEGGGSTLPAQVESVRVALANFPAAMEDFRIKLLSAGYLDRDSEHYQQHFIIKGEQLYRVAEGFPRIIAMPPGVGDLRYRVFLAACQSYRLSLSEYLTGLSEL